MTYKIHNEDLYAQFSTICFLFSWHPSLHFINVLRHRPFDILGWWVWCLYPSQNFFRTLRGPDYLFPIQSVLEIIFGYIIFSPMHWCITIFQLTRLRRWWGIMSVVIPDCTSKLQPFDISINMPFKQRVRQRWNKWIIKAFNLECLFAIWATEWFIPSKQSIIQSEVLQ